MTELAEIAPVFVEMAHRIVWCSAATVDPRGRPFTRILHPLWIWDGKRLHGWIATEPTPLKRAHLAKSANVSLSYWTPSHDTAQVECRAAWKLDDATRAEVWSLFKNAPAPVGYDPAIIPQWIGGPTSKTFGALHLEPWRMRVLPSSLFMTSGSGARLTWQE